MTSQASNEINEQKHPDDNEQESNNDDHVQRKRSRVVSHPDGDSDNRATNETASTTAKERSLTPVENSETADSNKTGLSKRRKLNVDAEEIIDQEEKTNDSVQSIITTTNSESKNESSTTSTTTDDDDEDVDDDDEDVDAKEIDEDDEEEEVEDDTNEKDGLPPTTNLYLRLRQRELGIFHRARERTTCRAFHNSIIADRNIVQRMKISHTLDGHNGCVNALSFNPTGKLLASASDDLQIILWRWASNQAATAYDSGHHSNVFQAKFIPTTDDLKIISCARDGQVRLAEFHPHGTLNHTKKLAQHTASAHKLSVHTIPGTNIFSCGEDGVVYHIDLRESKANKLLTVSSETINKLPLYSIELNRFDQNEFVVAGMDPYIRVFDWRFIDTHIAKPLKSFCPDLLKKIEDRQRQPSVTCAVYNYNGSEILGSYNDEDIYLFDASHSDGADAIRHYRGHRNNNTVKGVNFYGRNSEYIISGSDCGHVFIWDKTSEKCVWFAKGDEDGTVNVLEPHPHFPIIATSGLENDIKIWAPLSEESVDYKRLKILMRRNARERERELHFASVLDNDTGGLLRLMRPVFRRIVRRAQAETEQPGDDDDDDDDDDEDEEMRRHTYSFDCAPS